MPTSQAANPQVNFCCLIFPFLPFLTFSYPFFIPSFPFLIFILSLSFSSYSVLIVSFSSSYSFLILIHILSFLLGKWLSWYCPTIFLSTPDILQTFKLISIIFFVKQMMQQMAQPANPGQMPQIPNQGGPRMAMVTIKNQMQKIELLTLIIFLANYAKCPNSDSQ